MLEGVSSSLVVVAKGDSSFILLIVGVWVIVGIINAVVRKSGSQRPSATPPQPEGADSETTGTSPAQPKDEFQEFLETLRTQVEPAPQTPPPTPTQQHHVEPNVEVRIVTRTSARAERSITPAMMNSGTTKVAVPYSQPPSPAFNRSNLVGDLRSQHTWPNAIIMREILGPPIALRPPADPGKMIT